MPDVGRFFNVDPLSEKYMHNSTYAFSENKVVNGVELEGLEYVSMHHYTTRTVRQLHYKSSDKDIQRSNGTTAGSYNSASYGPLGKGVVHYYYNSEGSLMNEETRWDNRRTNYQTKLANHGLYSGPGSVTDRNGNYDFSLQPIDWADAIAKRHDMDYVNATASGEEYAGYLEDVRTLQADKDMLARVKSYLEKGSEGLSDVDTPFRTSSSGEMQIALQGQLTVIGALAKYKQWKIDNYYSNYDTYSKLRGAFKKHDPETARIIDLIQQ